VGFAQRHPTSPEKQNAREAVGLQTLECHSALTAMRRPRRECKRNSIYPRYSRIHAAPIMADRRVTPGD